MLVEMVVILCMFWMGVTCCPLASEVTVGVLDVGLRCQNFPYSCILDTLTYNIPSAKRDVLPMWPSKATV